MSSSDQNLPAEAGSQPEHAEAHTSVVHRVRNYFLTGLILVGPVYITLSLTWWFINWVDDVARPAVPDASGSPRLSSCHARVVAPLSLASLLPAPSFCPASLRGAKRVPSGQRTYNRPLRVGLIYNPTGRTCLLPFLR